MTEHFIRVVLGEKTRAIRFDNRARMRMGSLDRPFDVYDLSKPKKSFGALCAWLWACLVDRDGVETPEDVADLVTPENQTQLLDALIEAIKLGLPKGPNEKADAKNDSAESARGHASTSA